MEVTELFKDALTYPTKDWTKLLILGVFFLIMGIFSVLASFGVSIQHNIGAVVFIAISALLTLIVTIFVRGYCLSITRETINLREDIPEFEWGKNFIDGLKLVVLEIVYYIIPIIITILLIFLTGAFTKMLEISNYIIATGATTIPQELLIDIVGSLSLVIIIGGIFYIIFSLLYNIAQAKLAETDSLGEACNMIEVFYKIGEIGWANYIIWLIVLFVISFVIGFVMGIIQLIPIIGMIIAFLLISPFLQMFSSRALGLLYNESK